MTPGVAYPTRADYPPVEPVVCPGAPLLYPNIDGDTRRAGHCYTHTSGAWVCRYCEATP